MASNSPDAALIAEAEQLVLDLKTHSGSPTDQTKAVRRLDKLRCLLHKGPDALMFQAYPEAYTSISDRFLRIVLTQGIFNEKMPGVYEHTPASAIFRTDHAASFFRLGTMQFANWWKVSDYLKCHSAEDAQDATKVPFVWAEGKEGKTYFEALEDDPVKAEAWHKGMIMIETTQPIGGMFPFCSMKAAVEAEPHRAFVVDVGGGRGNALMTIMRECGGSFGAKMILQDMAEVVEGKDPVRIDGVENMPHNFYDAQPVKNAHIYYLRNVLHNHYDDRSLKILRRIVDAMGPTSRVLVGEMILPATAVPGSDPFPFFMDLNMFMEGGVERNEEQWRRLLGDAGLEIEKIWRLPDNPVQCTIEARLRV
ncbi:Demethylsterigmatocystin 6-O-methyltransferase [Madurella mycetomatis]|uniref:Demethylsterigmatocystin 6-O-methyltransferase n=1 Tax=Madurella mycetomatis TaxID=100816 RepID=A0A175VXU5_9PEZI|nr:Demethylsterigmatocystin 6-O-methyltransferase [Madurella mycetomatis]